MGRLSKNAGLFLVGVALSGVTFYFSHVRPRNLTRAARQESAAKTVRSALRRDFSTKGVFLDQQQEINAEFALPPIDEGALKADLAAGGSGRLMRDALNSESLQALQVIRPEFLSSIKDSELVLLPRLRSWLLESLVDRFQESDWKDWSRADRSNDGQPSRARRYVDRVLAVNSDLGSYLETASFLLAGLSNATRAGSPYDVTSGVRELIENSDELTFRRGRAPVRFMSMIVLDPSFEAFFERQRCRLVGDYIGLNRDAINAQLKLVPTLDAEYCEPNLFQEIGEILRLVANQGTAALRETVLTRERDTRTLDSFARSDDRVRDALAELYAVNAVDELEANNIVQARRSLSESIGLKPGLRSQTYLQEFFRQTTAKAQGSQEERPRVSFADVDLSRENAGGDSAFSLLGVGITMFFAGIGVILLVVFVQRLRRLDQVPTPPAQDPRPEPAVQLEALPTPVAAADVDRSNLVPMRVVKANSRFANLRGK